MSTYLALAADYHQSSLVCLLVDFKGLNSNTSLECRAVVVGTPHRIFGDVLDILQIMSPYTQGASTARFSREIMTGILDDQSQIVVPGEVDPQLHLRYG
jgi:hypothetical protein